MNYSILTIPTPKGCDECPCMSGITISLAVCGTTGSVIRDISKRSENCPLKSVKEEHEENRYRSQNP